MSTPDFIDMTDDQRLSYYVNALERMKAANAEQADRIAQLEGQVKNMTIAMQTLARSSHDARLRPAPIGLVTT